MKNIAALFIAGVGLSGCSAFGIVNAFSPSSHYLRYADINYGGEERQTLDVYVPKSLADDAPVVVFFYGGGWKSGERADYEFVAASLTAKGMIVVIPDYRLYPQVKFPVFVEDGAEAVAWAGRNIGSYGGSSDRIHLMGHSAGAHIAALIAFDRRILESRSSAAYIQIKTFIGLSGPYDFLPLNLPYLEDVFPEESRADSQPINFVSADAPPTLLIHGRDDEVVAPTNSEHLASALDQAGASVKLKLYEGVGHARVAAALAPPLGFTGATLEDTVSFIAYTKERSTLHLSERATVARP